MTNKNIYYLLISIGILLVSCEKKINMNIDGSTQSKDFRFECGVLSVNSYCVSRVYFYVDFNCILSDDICIDRELMLIQYSNKAIEYELRDKNNDVITDKEVILRNNQKYRVYFHINNPLPAKGDTITIKNNGYLSCKNGHNHIGDINIIIN